MIAFDKMSTRIPALSRFSAFRTPSSSSSEDGDDSHRETSPLLASPGSTPARNLCSIAMSLLNRVKTVLWGPETAEDRPLVIKLDFTLLPYFSLIWFLFGVNRASYSTAYISGMEEDLGFQGKDYNYMNTIYLVTYAVFQIPSTSLLTIAPPKYVFVAANVSWSVMTLITYRMQHVYQIFILNAFEGAFSAVAYVGAHFIYGSWYKKSELSTRAAVFCCFGHLGSMAGGWIQAGLLESANGKGGLPAWRWIFIIVSLITIPVAIFGKLY